jgi:hypothetical protein
MSIIKNILIRILEIAIVLLVILATLIFCGIKRGYITEYNDPCPPEAGGILSLIHAKWSILKFRETEQRFPDEAEEWNLIENNPEAERGFPIIFILDDSQKFFVVCTWGCDKIWGSEDDRIASSLEESDFEKKLRKNLK